MISRKVVDHIAYLTAASLLGNSLKTQGSHACLKVLEFLNPKFKALKVLENRTGA